MRKKHKIVLGFIVFAIICVVGIIGIYPSIYDYQCKNRIYEDMEISVESVMGANIRIIHVYGDEEEGYHGYSAGASGVIFGREDDRYYALTAYHVIHVGDVAKNIVATALTPTYDEYKKEHNLSGHVPPTEYYEIMPELIVEYENEESDLAIVSFRSSDEFYTVPIAEKNPLKGKRIVTVGNPDNAEKEYFVRTYGKITSSKETTFKSNDNQMPNQILKHNAYTADGSSGGAVFDEDMKLVGINIGGGVDFLGRYRYGAMIPCEQIRTCVDEWEK